MRPAWSVIIFTTLAGAGQGLFLALFAADAYDAARLSDLPTIAIPEPEPELPRVGLPKTRAPKRN